MKQIPPGVLPKASRMHFRALCPSVMLATVHSGVVNSPFNAPRREVELENGKRKRRRWSWFDPRETDEDDREAPSESSEEGVQQKENRPPRATRGRQQKQTSSKPPGTRPIEVKRPALETAGGFRRSPCMSFSPFARGIRYAQSPPLRQDAPTPPPPPYHPRRSSPPTPPPSPLASSPPEATVHAMVTVVSSQSQRIPGAYPGRALRREQLSSKRRGSLPIKSPLTMNPNQRFALVCMNDRFYWVSKEIETSP